MTIQSKEIYAKDLAQMYKMFKRIAFFQVQPCVGLYPLGVSFLVLSPCGFCMLSGGPAQAS